MALNLLTSSHIELIALYPWPYAVATWPMNSKFGMENAADGIHMDGTANYYSVEKGPDGWLCSIAHTCIGQNKLVFS